MTAEVLNRGRLRLFAIAVFVGCIFGQGRGQPPPCPPGAPVAPGQQLPTCNPQLPSCPPMSYCYATGPMDGPGPYYCCPILQNVGAPACPRGTQPITDPFTGQNWKCDARAPTCPPYSFCYATDRIQDAGSKFFCCPIPLAPIPPRCPQGLPLMDMSGRPLLCDAMRPWPTCPPESFCFATRRVEFGGPFYCCPAI